MRTQSIHDKGEQWVPRTVTSIKAIYVDKDPQWHSIKILRAGYIGEDEITKYPRQRWTVSIKDSYAYQGNRCWQRLYRHSIGILPAGYIGRDENTVYPWQRWTVIIKDRCWQGPTKTLDRNLTCWIHRKIREHKVSTKGEQWVSRTVRHIKAIDVDKDPQGHSIEILRAGYIGRDENTKHPWQRWTVSIYDSYVYQVNRCWQGLIKTLDELLLAGYIGRAEDTKYPWQRWMVSAKYFGTQERILTDVVLGTWLR